MTCVTRKEVERSEPFIEKVNMKKLFLTTLFVLFNAQANAEIVEIYSLDLIDDQRGFCIVIRGHKSKAKIV